MTPLPPFIGALRCRPGYCLIGAVWAALCCSAVADAPASRPVDIDGLIRQMTLTEKLGHLTQVGGGSDPTANPDDKARRRNELAEIIRSGSAGTFIGGRGAAYVNSLQRIAVEESRLKIPIVFANDVIHGYQTTFPIPLAEAASWSPEWIESACHVAATEARAAGTHWTYAPMIDVCRDPRWGRVAETAGEDPYLGSVIAAARVRGFQGDNPAAPDRMLACAKHYVAYGGAEGGRDYNTVDISLPTLHDIYLPTFEAAVRAGVGSIMSAFNEIGGAPASANVYTLRTVLRDRWQFRGVVISDWSSIKELIAHGVAEDEAAAAVLGLRAGVDIDMASELYRNHLAAAVERGEVPIALIDDAVRRALEMRVRLGLFENPYTDETREPRLVGATEHRAVAREVARRALVLLKNDANTLPLKRGRQKLALIGPFSEARRDLLGTWTIFGRDEDVVTILAGVRAVAGAEATIETKPGCDVEAPVVGGIEAALNAARAADAIILTLGESESMTGEGFSRASIELPAPQVELARAVFGLKKPTAVVLLTGRPLAIPWLAEHAPAILLAWHPGTEGGHAIADVLFGDFNPGGKLPATFPRATGQIPLYYNHKNTGRPPLADNRFTSKYIDVPWTPQFQFGFGLSYSSFRIEDIRVDPDQVPLDGEVEVRATVRNTSDRDGDEVVQVYYHDPVASLTRPVRQLCAFQRVTVRAGGSTAVQWRIPASRFGFHNERGEFVIEPGRIDLYVGSDSSATHKRSITLVAKHK